MLNLSAANSSMLIDGLSDWSRFDQKISGNILLGLQHIHNLRDDGIFLCLQPVALREAGHGMATDAATRPVLHSQCLRLTAGGKTVIKVHLKI